MGSAVTTAEVHEAKLDINVLQAQLPTSQHHMITNDTVDELRKFATDPDYGEEFLDVYRDHLNILSSNPKYTSRGYMSAVKFFSLIESGNKITNAYIMVFPERFKRRTARGQTKKDIRGEASRYNATALVNEIRKVATYPVSLIHRHLLHKAIIVQSNLMMNAKSELVRQKAAESLIKELKPEEDKVLSIQVDDGTMSAIGALHDAAEKLAIAEKQTIEAGGDIKTIIEGRIIHKEIIEEEVEVVEEPKVIKEKVVVEGEWKF